MFGIYRLSLVLLIYGVHLTRLACILNDCLLFYLRCVELIALELIFTTYKVHYFQVDVKIISDL